jgi:transcriptional regulator with XRE-family HTH domain
MNTYTPPVGDWVALLRNFTIGISMGSIILIPTVGSPVQPSEQQPVQSVVHVVTALPDRYVDPHTLLVPTRFGLEKLTVQEIVEKTIERAELNSIPRILRDMSGLPIETLASLAHVSRNAYYKWLDGKGVSDEHIARLTELLNTFRTIYDLQGSDFKEFLERPGPAGRPIDLLITNNNEAVIGLALRSSYDYVDSDSISSAARNVSGLPSWLRPTVKLKWGAPHLSSAELDHALDRLSPRPQFNQVESFSDINEEDEAFVAWGLVLE